MLQYIQENWGKYLRLLGEHLRITIIALLISLTLGIVIGCLVYHRQRISLLLTSITGGLRVIPSLVIMLLLMPWLGTGTLPATIALVLLGIPTILGNTVQGLVSTPVDVLESATACGMNNRQIFWQIRLPLALPSIITGARMSSLSVAAGATLAAYIGAGGLGELILSGISQYRMDILLAGAVTVMLISVILEILFQILYRLATRYRTAKGV